MDEFSRTLYKVARLERKKPDTIKKAREPKASVLTMTFEEKRRSAHATVELGSRAGPKTLLGHSPSFDETIESHSICHLERLDQPSGDQDPVDQNDEFQNRMTNPRPQTCSFGGESYLRPAKRKSTSIDRTRRPTEGVATQVDLKKGQLVAKKSSNGVKNEELRKQIEALKRQLNQFREEKGSEKPSSFAPLLDSSLQARRRGQQGPAARPETATTKSKSRGARGVPNASPKLSSWEAEEASRPFKRKLQPTSQKVCVDESSIRKPSSLSQTRTRTRTAVDEREESAEMRRSHPTKRAQMTESLKLRQALREAKQSGKTHKAARLVATEHSVHRSQSREAKKKKIRPRRKSELEPVAPFPRSLLRSQNNNSLKDLLIQYMVLKDGRDEDIEQLGIERLKEFRAKIDQMQGLIDRNISKIKRKVRPGRQERAAVIIQKHARGFLVRRMLIRALEGSTPTLDRSNSGPRHSFSYRAEEDESSVGLRLKGQGGKGARIGESRIDSSLSGMNSSQNGADSRRSKLGDEPNGSMRPTVPTTFNQRMVRPPGVGQSAYRSFDHRQEFIEEDDWQVAEQQTRSRNDISPKRMRALGQRPAQEGRLIPNRRPSKPQSEVTSESVNLEHQESSHLTLRNDCTSLAPIAVVSLTPAPASAPPSVPRQDTHLDFIPTELEKGDVQSIVAFEYQNWEKLDRTLRELDGIISSKQHNDQAFFGVIDRINKLTAQNLNCFKKAIMTGSKPGLVGEGRCNRGSQKPSTEKLSQANNHHEVDEEEKGKGHLRVVKKSEMEVWPSNSPAKMMPSISIHTISSCVVVDRQKDNNDKFFYTEREHAREERPLSLCQETISRNASKASFDPRAAPPVTTETGMHGHKEPNKQTGLFQEMLGSVPRVQILERHSSLAIDLSQSLRKSSARLEQIKRIPFETDSASDVEAQPFAQERAVEEETAESGIRRPEETPHLRSCNSDLEYIEIPITDAFGLTNNKSVCVELIVEELLEDLLADSHWMTHFAREMAPVEEFNDANEEDAIYGIRTNINAVNEYCNLLIKFIEDNISSPTCQQLTDDGLARFRRLGAAGQRIKDDSVPAATSRSCWAQPTEAGQLMPAQVYLMLESQILDNYKDMNIVDELFEMQRVYHRCIFDSFNSILTAMVLGSRKFKVAASELALLKQERLPEGSLRSLLLRSKAVLLDYTMMLCGIIKNKEDSMMGASVRNFDDAAVNFIRTERLGKLIASEMAERFDLREQAIEAAAYRRDALVACAHQIELMLFDELIYSLAH